MSGGWALDSRRRASEVEEGDGRACYMVANTTAAVVALAQLGVLELHTWGAKQDRLDRPDRMILDLDPAPEVRGRRSSRQPA